MARLTCPEAVPIWVATITKVRVVACIRPADSRTSLADEAGVGQGGDGADHQQGGQEQRHLGEGRGVADQRPGIELDAGGDEEDRDQEPEADALQLDLELRMRGPAGQVDRPDQQPGGEGAEDRREPEPAGEHGEGQGNGQGGADAQLGAAVLEPVEQPVQGGQVPDPREGQADPGTPSAVWRGGGLWFVDVRTGRPRPARRGGRAGFGYCGKPVMKAQSCGSPHRLPHASSAAPMQPAAPRLPR